MEIEIRKARKRAFDIEVGLRVRKIRDASGQTQEEFAENLDVSPQYISKVETGKIGLSTILAAEISRVYSISCDYILNGREEYNDISMILERAKLLDEFQLSIAEKNLTNQINSIAHEHKKHDKK